MKRSWIIIIAVLFLPLGLSAQMQGKRFEEMKALYKSERVSFLTEKLELTVGEAEKFWPVYNEFQEKREKLIEQGPWGRGRKHSADLSVEEMEKRMDQKIANDLKEAKLASEYHSKFKKILPIEKVYSLYKAERDFMGMMIRKMRSQDDNSEGRRRKE